MYALITECPNFFKPVREIENRSGNIFYLWQNVSETKHTFDNTEKVFLCQQLNNPHDRVLIIIPNKFVEQDFKRPIITVAGIVARHGISEHTIRNWIRRFQEDLPFYSCKGRPDEIDEIGLDWIKSETIRIEIEMKDKMEPRECYKLLIHARADTLKRKNRAKGDFVTFTGIKRSNENDDFEMRTVPYSKTIPLTDLTFDHRTVKIIEESCSIKTRKAKDLTEARYKALMDIRLIYIFACMVWAFCRWLKAEDKYNGDCSTLVIPPKGSGRQICVVREVGDVRKVESRGVVIDLNVLIKCFGLGAGSGELAPLLLIIGVKGMTKGVFFKAEVPGLNHLSDRTSGFMYFSHDKNGCIAMWTDIYLNFIIPFIRKGTAFHKHKDANGEPSKPCLFTDGEANIMDVTFQKEVLDGFESINCRYCKSVPSGTSQTQEFDVGKMFMNIKTGVKSIAKEGTNVGNETLETNLEVLVFDKFKEDFPEVSISSDFKAKVIYGALVFVFVTKKYWSPYCMQQSFLQVGTHQIVPKGEVTVNFDRLMTKSINKMITPADFEHMQNKRDLVAEEILREGIRNAYLIFL